VSEKVVLSEPLTHIMYRYMSVCIGHGRPLSGSVPAILQKAGHQASLQGPAPNHRAKDGAIWLGAMGDARKRWVEYTVYIICLRYIFKKENQQKIKTWISNSSCWILLFYLVLGLLYIYITCIYYIYIYFFFTEIHSMPIFCLAKLFVLQIQPEKHHNLGTL
jgi:hypothetical protein